MTNKPMKIMRRKLIPIVCLIVIGTVGGCRNNSDDDQPSKPGRTLKVDTTFKGEYPIKVLCTTGMLADIARNVGGDHVKVTQLLEPGIDPHVYKPTTTDRDECQKADVIFYSGLHLEAKLAEIFESMKKKGRPTFPVAEYLAEKQILKDDEGHHDPHVWFDVSLWMDCAKVMRDVLVKYDPDAGHQKDYEKNAKTYLDSLEKIDAYATEQIKSIPDKQRVLVTAHDAFQYFGKRYKIPVKAIQGISTEGDASLKKINELVEFITKNQIKAVFAETTVNPRAMKTLIEGCESKGHKVVLVGAIEGESLYSDSMGSQGSPGETYVGMIRHNVDMIVKFLK